ncbi:unnamed protein product [Rhizophagus irregularis]|nr:unnamed protein product [Rhizophagus irregularis]
MDDTSYLDSSGDKIQASINIATQFYHFHDIDINGKKSELMVINPKVPRDELYITIGRDNSKIQATDKEIRYLGCYFSSSNLRKRSIKRIKDIIEKFLNPIRRKRITVGYITYLINHVLIPRVSKHSGKSWKRKKKNISHYSALISSSFLEDNKDRSKTLERKRKKKSHHSTGQNNPFRSNFKLTNIG